MTNSTPGKTDHVAVLGAGTMGAPIARNIAARGFAVSVWNRTRSKAEFLAADGIHIADTPAEAVRGASIILTMLNDGQRVREAMEAAAPELKDGAIWAQMSTVGIQATRSLAAYAAELGTTFYDSPVQGSRLPAEKAQLVVLASGPAAGRDRIQPIYDAIGKRTIWVGDDGASGASSRLKLALNHYALTLTHAVAESLSLAAALDVELKHLIDVVSDGPMDNAYFQMKSAAIVNDDFKPSFTIANALKDARLIAQAAGDAGMKADLAEAGATRFQRALDRGHGDKDMAASYLAS